MVLQSYSGRAILLLRYVMDTTSDESNRIGQYYPFGHATVISSLTTRIRFPMAFAGRFRLNLARTAPVLP